MQESKIEDIEEAQKAPIDFLTFSGGGAKGAIYSGVFDSLADNGVMKQVKSIAGSSAGAITAAFIATGMSPKEFHKLSAKTNFENLLHSNGKKLLKNDGLPLLNFLRTNIKDTVRKFIEDLDDNNGRKLAEICTARNIIIRKELDESLEAQQKIIDQKIKAGEALANAETVEERAKQAELIAISDAQLKFFDYKLGDLEAQRVHIGLILNRQSRDFESLKDRCKSNDGKILFRDLAILRSLDPEAFKDLRVTAVEKKSSNLKIFSSDDTPDVEIALAAKASASIPLVFKGTVIESKKYVDGGYRDNTPTNHFKKETTIEDFTNKPRSSKKGRTIACAFSSGPEDNVHKAIYTMEENIYTPNKFMKFIINTLFKKLARVGGDFQYTDEEEKNLKNLQQNALNVLPLDTKPVSTLSFNKAQEQAPYLHAKGYIDTQRYLENHNLATKIDPHLEQKEFVLGLYSEVIKSKGFWTGKVKKAEIDEKSKELLEFTTKDSKKWDNPALALEEVIAIASTHKDRERSLSNRGITKLVNTLNKTDTSLATKTYFIDLIQKKDPTFSIPKDIAKFKFTNKHLDKVAKQARGLALQQRKPTPAEYREAVR
ncbi:MAG UNVERIFIED_CONTAM: patatin-like phospholipase family protein [Rickettsiaceae bacterium]|jgi:NTE family protein